MIRVAGRTFAPRLWPTVMTVIMLAVLIGLGVWQLQRAAWKAELISAWQAQQDAPPMEDLVPAEKAHEALFHKTRLLGKYLNDKSVMLVSRAMDGVGGSELITPFRLITGEIILVDRGFVASESHGAIDQPIGSVFVDGEWRDLPKKGWMQPDNHPADDQWYWLDAPVVAAAKGLSAPYPLLLVAIAKPLNNVWPKATPPGQPYTNNHLTYAFTWFSLALALGVIYFLSQSKKDA